MRSKLIQFFVTGLSLYFLLTGIGKINNLWQGKLRLEREKAHFETLLEDNRNLRLELESRQQPEFIEAVARDKLGLAKPGETVVIVPTKQKTGTEENGKLELPRWQQWFKLLFGS